MTIPRPPITTIVGHIDHGKSTLLDALRNVQNERKEAGDITQHIGAYEITTKYEGVERKLTMIDTPGHEAFTNLRESSIALADIALLIVSSEDGFKEQTKEAYDAIQNSGKPFIVVFTKSDSEKSDIEKSKTSLLENNIYLEKLGGSIPWTVVSAKTGEGVDKLVELIFLTSDLYEITEDGYESVGVVLETHIDTKAGIVATILVKNGTIKKGDFVLAGNSIAPARIICDDKGKRIDEASPSSPIQIFGFDSLPEIYTSVSIFPTKKEALSQKDKTRTTPKIEPHDEDKYSIPVIVKADTAGGLDSVLSQIDLVAAEGTAFRVIKEGVGNITEDDITYATSHPNTKIVGFHTGLDTNAEKGLRRVEIECRLFDTIYELTEWIESFSKKEQRSDAVNKQTGEAEVIRLFEKGRQNIIIGAEIRNGSIALEQTVLFYRNGKEVGEGKILQMEQRNESVECVDKEKEQVAIKIATETSVNLKDTLIAIPT